MKWEGREGERHMTGKAKVRKDAPKHGQNRHFV